jgi:hypothetical protein
MTADTSGGISVLEPASVDQQPAVRNAILILGMHRSGTSALSRVLNLMGMQLGSDLMPPAPDNNETGFWEHRIFQWINRRIFESVGREWDSVLSLPPKWWEQPQMEGFREELKAVIQGEFGNSALWGLKDPRVCFMLPLWQPLLAQLHCRTQCVLTFRNPMEVARSLQKRDGLPISQSHLMWLRSLLEAERDSRGMSRTLTSYEALLSDWKSQVHKIGRELGFEWPVACEQVSPAVDEFLRPSLRHHQVDNHQLLEDSGIAEPVRRAYGMLLDAAASGRVDDLSAPLDAIADELAHNHPMITQYIADLGVAYSVTTQQKILEKQRYETELAAARQQIAATQSTLEAERIVLANEHAARLAAQAELINVQASLIGTQGAMLNTQTSLVAAQEALVNEQKANAVAKQRIGEWEQHARDLDALVHSTRHEYTLKLGEAQQAAQQNAQQLNASIAEKDRSISQKDQELAAAQAALLGYQEQRFALLDLTRKIWQSRSWKWSAPLRKLEKVRLTADQLIPSPMLHHMDGNRWRSEGPANFTLPCFPIKGRMRVQAKLRIDVPSQVLLYYDTGTFFKDEQRFNLGNFGKGQVEIDQTHVLPETTWCFRFDPVQSPAEFTIERFEILFF